MGARRAVGLVVVVLAASVLTVESARAGTQNVTTTVVRWIDGDTVDTPQGRVRLIGFNAPDRQECGYRAAKRLAKKVAPKGSTVTLSDPDSVQEADEYGRLLRYVSVGNRDIGLKQIKAGSQAKYDSTDGHDAHPKQARYRRQDIMHRDYCGSSDLRSYAPVSTSACPRKAPIKGNRGDDWIYHLPTNRYYEVTQPEECFASGDGAKKAGYRAALV